MKAASRPDAHGASERVSVPERWDLFCHVVDNYGDIGATWRLARALAQRGIAVRLFADAPAALDWMAPRGCEGVRVVRAPGLGPEGFRLGLDHQTGAAFEPAEVIVTTFGCQLPADVLEAASRERTGGRADGARGRIWIHLEYLSAEPYVERSHGLASPLPGVATDALRKWFYFPGFTPASGGLMREPELLESMRRFDRRAWLAARGVAWAGEPVVSLFCYEPASLGPWLAGLSGTRLRLLVAHGRTARAYEQAAGARSTGEPGGLQASLLPALEQSDYDHLLWASDVNFVRGEDSLVRALWAGVPLVWQAYPQSEDAHRSKVAAFLDWLQAPASLRRFTLRWNGLEPGPLPPLLESAAADDWRQAVIHARAGLLAQDDLVSRLLRFVTEKRLK
jgi:uncharacterized repeat protein (TIGR03837 family)